MKQVNFANDKIVRNILSTAMPLMAAQVLNLLYNIVDRIYIARIPEVGTQALGSVGLCFPIILMVSAFTNLYGLGGAPLFSIELGKGDRDEAGRLMNTAFFLEISTGIVLMVLGMLFAGPMLRLFGASDTALEFSVPYIRIYLIGTLFTMTAAGMNPYINAQGFSLIGMFSVAIGAVANLLLDPLFIFAFGLGIRGAAIATVLSQAMSAAFSLSFLRGKKTMFRLKRLTFDEIRHSGQRILNIVSLGVSSFVMQVTNSLVQIACNNVLSATGGDLYITIMTIVNSIRQMMDTPVHSIAEGSIPVISFNYGARKAARVLKSMLVMMIMGVICTLVMWFLILRFPAKLISVFSSDVTILDDAIPALQMYFGAYIFMTLQFCGQTVFKALNKRKFAIFFSIFRKVIIVVPLTYLLPYALHMGTDGVFRAEAVSNVIGGLACFITMVITVIPELRRMAQEEECLNADR